MVPHQQLRVPPSDSIIADTSIGGTAELAWSLYQGIINDFNRYFYLLAPSLPWPNSLDFLFAIGRTMTRHFITEGFHATTTPTLLFAENGYFNIHYNFGRCHFILNANGDVQELTWAMGTRN